MEGKTYTVYILASKQRGVLYIGFTGNLAARIWQHKQGVVEGFTKHYMVKKLVYYELFGEAIIGIQREKQLKKWNRDWKIQLIEKHNPEWVDLYNKGEILSLPIQ
jgi:putative endonuclease